MDKLASTMISANVTNQTNHSTVDLEDYDYYDDTLENDLPEILPVAIVYAITLIIGIIGNVLIIVTIGKCRRMRTITNVFLTSLASADLLLVIICIPIKFAKLLSFTWTMGEFLCKSVHYIQNVSAICSVLTLTSMSLERYYAIIHPIKAKYLCTISQAQKVILLIWIFSFILAIPTLLMQIMLPVGDPGRNFYWCVIDWDNRIWWQVYEIYLLTLLLILPTTVMGFAYTCICSEVWQVMRRRVTMVAVNLNGNGSTREFYPMTPLAGAGGGDDSNSTPTGSLRPRNVSCRAHEENVTIKQVIKMLVAIVFLFILCWTPLMVNNVLTAFGVLPEESHGYMKPMRSIFHLMAYLNSCINPIVYGFMSRNFRESFYHAICWYTRASPSRQMSFTQTRTTSVSMARSLSVSTNERHGTEFMPDARYFP